MRSLFKTSRTLSLLNFPWTLPASSDRVLFLRSPATKPSHPPAAYAPLCTPFSRHYIGLWGALIQGPSFSSSASESPFRGRLSLVRNDPPPFARLYGIRSGGLIFFFFLEAFPGKCPFGGVSQGSPLLVWGHQFCFRSGVRFLAPRKTLRF